MEILRGKTTSFLDSAAFTDSRRGYSAVHLDLGTGDGGFVRHLAQTMPQTFVLGVDACRENLHKESQRVPINALFIIANAESLPPELTGLISSCTVNFPWGSLLSGLLTPGSSVLESLRRVLCADSALTIRLNSGALAEAGWTLEGGAERVRESLRDTGFNVNRPRMMTANDLKAFPSTWGKRLAFGRDPRAVVLKTR